MALIECNFFSDVLGLSTAMTVILPQETSAQIGMSGSARDGDPPVLYLLHGLSDDHTIWLRRTSIERYVAPLGLAVVMPQFGRSFYTDQAHGDAYFTFLSEELPRIVASFFRVSTRREDTFVAGLSMGGYGAFKWALRQPQRFAAAASLSGALDVDRLLRDGGRPRLFDAVFDNNPVQGTTNCVFTLLENVDQPALPRLYACCGTEDPVYPDSERFVAAARDRGVEVTAQLGPGGHEWGYWDDKIQDVLDWMLQPNGPRATGGDRR